MTAETDISPMPEARSWRRALIKVSGEALMGSGQQSLDPATLTRFADELVCARETGSDICVVIGGGNIVRGGALAKQGFNRPQADAMGMLATGINALALQDAIERRGGQARVMSAIAMDQVCEPYLRRRALRHLEKGRIVLCAGGVGAPFFTTDTAAALRALELRCDVMIKGTKVDGIYDKDPARFAEAKRYRRIAYSDAAARDLKVMDAAAIALCREHAIPVAVFSIVRSGELGRVLRGEGVMTLLSSAPTVEAND